MIKQSVTNPISLEAIIAKARSSREEASLGNPETIYRVSHRGSDYEDNELAADISGRRAPPQERFTRIKLEEGHALHEAYPPNAELRPLYLEWRKGQPEYEQYPFAFKDE